MGETDYYKRELSPVVQVFPPYSAFSQIVCTELIVFDNESMPLQPFFLHRIKTH